MTEAQIWYSKDFAQKTLPGDCRNTIVLSDEFYREITSHPIPTDLEDTKALSSCPAALDLYMRLSCRSFTAKGKERVPLFGEFGLASQLGVPTMRESFARSWRVGYIWWEPCGQTGRLPSIRVAPGCMRTEPSRSCLPNPQRHGDKGVIHIRMKPGLPRRVSAGYRLRGSTTSPQLILVRLEYRLMANPRRSTARSRCTWQSTSVAGVPLSLGVSTMVATTPRLAMPSNGSRRYARVVLRLIALTPQAQLLSEDSTLEDAEAMLLRNRHLSMRYVRAVAHREDLLNTIADRAAERVLKDLGKAHPAADS
jgi:hypothetical protein